MDDGIISGDEEILLKPPRKKKKIVKCKNCKYIAHTNPPSHFISDFTGYCCLWCKLSNGSGHGNQCQRRFYIKNHNWNHKKKMNRINKNSRFNQMNEKIY